MVEDDQVELKSCLSCNNKTSLSELWTGFFSYKSVEIRS